MEIESHTDTLGRCVLDAEKVLDLDLFPDIQLPGSNTPTDINGLELHECDDVVNYDDDDLMGYLNRDDLRTIPVSPAVGGKNNKGNAKNSAIVKVVTLKQRVPQGNKIIVVEKSKIADSMMTVSAHGPTSPTSSNGDSEPGLCMSKNAIAARENRQKKKKNLVNLENRVSELSEENTKLKSNVTEMTNSIESLRNEVKYLRAVLANQSTLASLLKKIPTAGFNLSSSSMSMSRTELIKKHPSTRKRPASPVVNIPTDSEDEEEENEEDCDCHPEKNVCMCTKENRYNKSQKNGSKNDHSYGVNTRIMSAAGSSSQAKRKKIQQQKADDKKAKAEEEPTAAGVCLHVSGESVSLEFCSSCSSNAASSRKR